MKSDKTNPPIVDLGKTNLPVIEYALQGNAILGIRDSGKSYTATYIAERLLDNGIPFVAFDPIGVWKYLRLPGNGKAYKVVVAGGKDGDLQLTPKSAPEIVRAAMRENIPLIIDLYDITLSKADWKSIVEQSVRLLLHENGEHGLRHIFIEEAAEFVPQRIGPDQGRVYAEIEKLARMGGNAKLGYTLINQRAEEVNKAVLELCDCLFLHRQKGRNSLTALAKWLDFINSNASKKIIETMPTLEQGQCWIWAAGSVDPVLTHIPAKRSLHPDRRANLLSGNKLHSIQETDVSAFIASMSATIQTHLEQIHNDDPARLKRRIAELERLLKENPIQQIKVPVPVVDQETITKLITMADDLIKSVNVVGVTMAEKSNQLYSEVQKALENINHPMLKMNTVKPRNNPRSEYPPEKEINFHMPGRRLPDHPSNPMLGKAQRSILKVLAMFPNGKTDRQIAILSGYAVGTGGFNNAMSGLRTNGFIQGDRNTRTITQNGLLALGDDRDELPTGGALIEYWRGKLGKAQRSAFDVLLNIYPNVISRDDLASRAGYKPGTGGINNAISRLNTLELSITEYGFVRANPTLFE